MKKLFQTACLALIAISSAYAQSVSVNWNTTYQAIDGFGAANAQQHANSMSPANESFFFGTGAGEIGLSILRVGVSDGGNDPGTCFSVSSGCAGTYVADMAAINQNGGRVYASAFSPPSAYKTNDNIDCTDGGGSGTLIAGDYGAYATYLVNFVQSVKTYASVDVFAVSLQNEPNYCAPYDAAIYSAAQLDTLVKAVGPAFQSAGLTTLIFLPESDNFTGLDSYGNTCMTDKACSKYVAGNNWHDYDATFSAPDTVSAAANPWASSGKRYWETEVSTLGNNVGPDASGCTSSGSSSEWCPGMTDALMWAAIIDNRIAVQSANAWLYWLFITPWNDNEGLMNPEGSVTVASRAYVMGNYSKFVRPGWVRISATHAPTSGVTISAYKDPSGSGNFAIVATNYNSSSSTLTFLLNNFSPSAVAPWLTSATSNLVAQPSIAVSSNSFSATLPAQSVTTFVPGPVAAPTDLKAVPH